MTLGQNEKNREDLRYRDSHSEVVTQTLAAANSRIDPSVIAGLLNSSFGIAVAPVAVQIRMQVWLGQHFQALVWGLTRC